jgi:hypothetical protein
MSVAVMPPPAARSEARRPSLARARRLALAAPAPVLLAVGAAYALAALNHHDLGNLAFLLTTPVAALVGGLIVARRPANPVGWLILGHALCFSLGELCRQYALYGLVTRPGALPLAYPIASVPYWIWGPGVACGFILWPLVFPDGRLVAPGWRLAVWYAVGATAVQTLLMAVQPGDHETPGVANPLGVAVLALADGRAVLDPRALWLSSALIAAASLVVRYRRAAGVERQQIRWPAYAVGLALAAVLPAPLLPPALVDPLALLSLGGIWVAIGVAILRHRLYDIDRLINRTLVYGALTGLLAAVYAAGVVLLQAACRAVTGQESDLAIVATTLAVAVLFRPLRRRIQAAIDHRFHRRAYDAAQMQAAFSQAARDEVDLARLTAELARVVDEAMRPSHVSLWLREPAAGVK